MGISRRNLLLTGGGAAAIAALPTTRHVKWNLQDFNRNDYVPNLPPASKGETAWMNWSGIQRATPKQISVPASEDELANLIKKTEQHIRPVGSGHSFTGLVPSEGTIIDLSRLSGLISHDTKAQTVTFGAGTRLRQAARDMSEIGLAWPNMPDVDVQTIAGSFSTATHGTGLSLRAMHDQILSFRMVTASGDILNVSQDNNIDLFRAGKVSLGALGVITQYTLRMMPKYNLHRQVWVEKIETMLEQAQEMASKYRNFECYYFPNTGYGAIITHNLHAGPITGRGESADDTTLNDLKKLRDLFGWSPWLRRKLMSSSLPTGYVEDESDESWRLLATTRPIKFNEIEYHLPYENGIKGAREIIAYLDQRKECYFPVEMRWTGQDDAMLSPFNSGPRMSIAVHAAVNENYDYFFKDIEPLHLANGGRPHWGKLHSLEYEQLLGLYPEYERFAKIRKNLDPTGKFLNPHLAKLFAESFNA